MADPVDYVPGYSFSGWQTANPSKPLPAPHVDDEFARISQAVIELVDAVKDIRRSDGKLQNGVVTLEALASGIQLEVAVDIHRAEEAADAAEVAQAGAEVERAAAQQAKIDAQQADIEAKQARTDAQTYRDQAQAAAEDAVEVVTGYPLSTPEEARQGQSTSKLVTPATSFAAIDARQIDIEVAASNKSARYSPIVRATAGFLSAAYYEIPPELVMLGQNVLKATALTSIFDLATGSNRDYFDASGNVIRATDGQARIGPNGMLIEPTSKNEVSNPRADLSNGWSAVSASCTTLALAANGIFPGVEVGSSGDQLGRAEHQNYTAVSGEVLVVSAFYRLGTSGKVLLAIREVASGNVSSVWANSTGQTIIAQAAGTLEILGDEPVVPGNATRRLTVRFVPNFAGAARAGIGPYSTAVGETVIVLAAQIEKRRTPTSYINGAATRPNDVLRVTNRLMAQRGALLLEFERPKYLPLPTESELGIISVTSADNRGLGVIFKQATTGQDPAVYDYAVQITRRTDSESMFDIHKKLLPGTNRLFFAWDMNSGECWFALNGSLPAYWVPLDSWTPQTVQNIQIGFQRIQGTGNRQFNSSIRSATLFDMAEIT